MKSFVFILLTLALLLLSEAVTLLSTKAATAPTPLQVQALDFYYKQDEKVRYLDLKQQWQTAHRGELPVTKAAELADQAYSQATIESPLEEWNYQGGPSPQVLSGQIHLYNTSQQALLNVPLTVSLRAQVGELRVNPLLQMTDYKHLEASAQWQSLSNSRISIPVIAPGEDMLVDVARFQLLQFLAKHPSQWPARLEIEVKAPHMATSRKTLTLIPDHFVVPVLY